MQRGSLSWIDYPVRPYFPSQSIVLYITTRHDRSVGGTPTAFVIRTRPTTTRGLGGPVFGWRDSLVSKGPDKLDADADGHGTGGTGDLTSSLGLLRSAYDPAHTIPRFCQGRHDIDTSLPSPTVHPISDFFSSLLPFCPLLSLHLQTQLPPCCSGLWRQRCWHWRTWSMLRTSPASPLVGYVHFASFFFRLVK